MERTTHGDMKDSIELKHLNSDGNKRKVRRNQSEMKGNHEKGVKIMIGSRSARENTRTEKEVWDMMLWR